MITLAFFKFEINIFSLVAFLAGIVSGGIILALFYIYWCFKDINKNSIRINKNIKNVPQSQIDDVIHKYQESFEDEKYRRGGKVPINSFKSGIWEMMNEIAGSFYPKSKRPLCELSINEMIALDKYIVAKLEGVLSHKGLRLFKGLKVNSIISIVEASNKVNNNSIVQTAKKYHLKKIYNTVNTALKVLNPITWFKKLVINPSINLIIDRLCLICYNIVGEETYNVYSKQAFVEDENQIKQLLKDIEEQNITKDNLVVETPLQIEEQKKEDGN